MILSEHLLEGKITYDELLSASKRAKNNKSPLLWNFIHFSGAI